MMFSTNKKQKQIRKKVIDEDDINNNENENQDDTKRKDDKDNQPHTSIIEDDQDNTPTIIKHNNNSLKKKNTFTTKKPTTTTPKPLLSFGGDDTNDDDHNGQDGDDTELPSFSLRNKSLRNATPVSMKRNDFQIQSSATSLYQQSVGEYTNEKLDKLKSTTSSRSSFIDNHDNNNNSVPMDIDNIIGNDKDDNEDINNLPTIEQIKAAKEKRNRLREENKYNEQEAGGMEEDFISINPAGKKNQQNRQSNIQDKMKDSDEEEDDESDIGSDNESNKRRFGDPGKENVKKMVEKSVKKGDDIEEEEEEEEEVKRWHLDQIKKGGGIANNVTLDSQSRKHQQDLLLDAPSGRTQKILGITVSDQLETPFIDRLVDDIDQALVIMEEVHGNHVHDQSKAHSSLESSRHNLMEEESEQHVIEDEINYYLEFQQYIKNMSDCLEDKMPLIEEFEESIMTLAKDRAGEQRRSDEPLEQETQQYYQNEMIKVQEQASQVLNDVDEDYSVLVNIRDKFQHWKQKNYRSYRRVNLGFIIPAIFAPFIRLQLINWNPLSSNNSFEKYPWYNQLENYGILKNIEMDSEDPDHNLIPKLVSKIIVPKVETFIDSIWNPLSNDENRNLKSTIEDINIYIDDISHLNSQILLKLKEYSNYMENDLETLEFNNSIQLFECMSWWYGFFDEENKFKLSKLCTYFVNSILLPYFNRQNKNDNQNIDNLIDSLERIIKYIEPIQLGNQATSTTTNLLKATLTDIQSQVTQNQEIKDQFSSRLTSLTNKLGNWVN